MTGHAILTPMLMAVIMGLCLLVFCIVVLAFGYFSMGLETAALGFGLVLNGVKIPLFK